ncbi:PriCT-2 domain-containing protein [Bradyrhizobium valentinum]
MLADLPTDTWREDRDGWLQVGMALHHVQRQQRGLQGLG